MYKYKKICVIIPAFNEEKKIGAVIDGMPDYVDNIIVVNDGSTDETANIARSKGAIVVTHQKNEGLGSAFRSGLKKTIELNADIMVNIDADGQFNPEDIDKLIQPIVDKEADFVSASRFKNPDYYPKMPTIKFYGNKIMSFLITSIVGQKFYDVSCGFRAYSRDAYLRLNLFGDFTYTQETFLDLAFKNVSVAEVPVIVKGTREHGKSKLASNLFRYGYQTSKIILKSFRDYNPLGFFAIISLLFFLISFALGSFLMIHYINTGAFTPHKWAGFTSAFFVVMSLSSFMVGFILDMFARMRKNQEEILFYLKNNQISQKHE